MALRTLPPLEVVDMQHEAWLKAMDEVGAVLCLVSHLSRFMSRGKWQLSADTTHAALSTLSLSLLLLSHLSAH